jgi:hypothetical protein
MKLKRRMCSSVWVSVDSARGREGFTERVVDVRKLDCERADATKILKGSDYV